jgi:hypothetical protein
MQASYYSIIMIATFAITVGTLIWRMAILHHQCITNKESLIRAHDRVDKLEEAQTVKIEDLSSQLKSVREVQIRMEEKLNLLLKMKRANPKK